MMGSLYFVLHLVSAYVFLVHLLMSSFMGSMELSNPCAIFGRILLKTVRQTGQDAVLSTSYPFAKMYA